MIDREGAALLAQVAATFFVALAVSSLVVQQKSNPIRRIDTTVEIVATFSTLFVSAGATAIAVFDLKTTSTTGWLLGVPSAIAVLGVANLLHGVLTERWRQAGESPTAEQKTTE
jgi:hypothetical protein